MISNKIEWVDPQGHNVKIAPFSNHNLTFIKKIKI